MISKAELTLIAQLEMAHGTSRNVKGMESFFDFFVKKLSLSQRKLAHRYLKIKEDERLAFIKSAEEAGWSQPAPKVRCAACDRGDFQLGHHHDCPRCPSADH